MGEILLGVVIVLAAGGYAAWYMLGSASYGTKKGLDEALESDAAVRARGHRELHRRGFCGRGASGHW